MISFYLQGLTLGLAYVAPIGMQNLFVINSALTQSWHRAMATAMIVTFWDISLGLACFLGVGAFMEALPWLQEIILGIGGLFILYIGMNLIRAKADLSSDQDLNRPLRKIALSAFVVTWLNPQALIDGTLMLGAFRATLPIGADSYFIAGFASASFLWFTFLSIAIHLLGSKINNSILTWLNRLCGTIIILYSLKLLSHLLSYL